MKTIDICNKRTKEMKEDYYLLKNEIKAIEAKLEELNREKDKLRQKEVDNVLEYVRDYSRLGVLDNNDIDTYLCHCQNMLKGNIDGTFLTFHKE